jgi:hypothetical protein
MKEGAEPSVFKKARPVLRSTATRVAGIFLSPSVTEIAPPSPIKSRRVQMVPLGSIRKPVPPVWKTPAPLSILTRAGDFAFASEEMAWATFEERLGEVS